VKPRHSIDCQYRPRTCAVLAAQLDIEAGTVVFDAQSMRLVAVFVQDPPTFGVGFERRLSASGQPAR
jgi:hypothetical protein